MIFLGIFLSTWVQPAIAQTQSVVASTLTVASDKLNSWTSVGSTASHWCTTCVRQSALPPAALLLTAPRPRASLTQRMKLVSQHTECRKFFLVEQRHRVLEILKNWAEVIMKERRAWSWLETLLSSSWVSLKEFVMLSLVYPLSRNEFISVFEFF